jgi:repressor LexA
MVGLTQRQQMVLDYIRQSIVDRGYPPTLREIGARMGIRSTNGVNDHLRALERKGYLTREDMKSRALRPLPFGPPSKDARPERDGRDLNGESNGAAQAARDWRDGRASQAAQASSRLGGASNGHFANELPANDDELLDVPILGRVAAGLPLLAEEQVIDTVRIDRGLLKGGREVFGLRVQGDSMIEAGILSGDYIFVKKQITAQRGEIVVALIGDEATVKYYYPEKDYVRFQPANRTMAPILVRAVDFRATMLLGVVVGIFRRI